MSSSSAAQYSAAHHRPPTVNAYDGESSSSTNAYNTPSSTSLQQLQEQQQQPLRRRGAPVPAPHSLYSTKSSATHSLHSTQTENPYEATSTASPSSSVGTATTSPSAVPRPRRGPSARGSRRSDTPHDPSTTSTTTTTSSPSAASSPFVCSSSARARHSRRGGAKRGDTAPSAGGAPRSLSRRARDQSSRTSTPEDRLRGESRRPDVPLSRGPGSAPPSRRPPVDVVSPYDGPTVVRATSPASLLTLPDGERQRLSALRDETGGGSSSGGGCRSAATSPTSQNSALPPHVRQETAVPGSDSGAGTALTSAHSASTSSSGRVVTAGPVIMTGAERKKAERDARKQLRQSMYDGNITVHGYVAQTAYAQKNPFRRQDFAEFAANPQYQPPEGFDIYSQALATRVYGLEVSRASQGEFMMQRLVEAAQPATAEERAEMEALLSSTLERLQEGDWFYKWTRINHVHQRYVWLNLQRGTLMWSLGPKQSVVLNTEVKLSTVMSITPDCLQLEAPMRVFYRMTINTPDRCISLATEIRKKFDVWYRVLLQLTAPNLIYGVPGVWGRPSSSVNTTGRGAASRWASRYSPLDAVVNDTTGHLGHDGVYTQGLLSSSD